MIENPQQFPEKTFFLQGNAGKIECLAGHPAKADEDRKTVGIICHPHPLFGGTMHNKVTHMIEKAFRELGLHTVRFNFRGVGESEGEFDNGIGETEDVLSIYRWLMEIFPEHEVWLAGFSFGSYTALRASKEIKPQQFLTVAPPVERFNYTDLSIPECPWLVIQGEDDDVVTPKAVYSFVNSLDPRPQLITFKAGHFFHRRLLDLKGAIKNGILRQLPSAETTQEN
ncbi:MAG TPA: alpha/beta hydrolase [Oceanospirillales bacterium]|nr:alpha/beta hydrolase [Oceanospirillales bacterium]